MSNWTKEQRAIAAAHLCDLFAKALRGGDMYDSSPGISLIVEDDRAEEFYWYGLGCYGASEAEKDVAVAAIARSEHPPGSLPGRVTRMHNDAARPAGCPVGSEGWCIEQGAHSALDSVLSLLGCEVPK